MILFREFMKKYYKFEFCFLDFFIYVKCYLKCFLGDFMVNWVCSGYIRIILFISVLFDFCR